jgi:hypothetical protein
MNAPLKSLDTQFAFAPQTPIYDRLNRLLVVLEARFRGVEATKADYEGAVDKLTTLGLARINETLGPATQKILDLTSLGFLICESESSMLLETGVDKSIIVTAGTSRDLFAPTAFVAVQRKSNFTDWGYAEVQSYNPVNGALALRFLAIYGDPGPHGDWQISDAPGISEATYYWYLQTVAARDAAVVARTAAQVAQAAAEDAAAVASTATGADISILVRRDGTTAFTAAQSGVAPAAAADNNLFPTTSWVWDRLDAYDVNYPLLNGTRDFNQVQRGVSPAAAANGAELTTSSWTLNRITERLVGFTLRNGGTPFTGVQAGVAPANPADNTANLVTSAWANARITTLITQGGWNFAAYNTGPTPPAGANGTQIPNAFWVQSELTTRINALINAAPGTLDTLGEIATALQADQGSVATLTTAVGNRLRFDSGQSLSDLQKVAVQANAGIITTPQCYLYFSANTLVLVRDGGKFVPVGGYNRILPASINFDANGLAVDVTYGVYVYDPGTGVLQYFFDTGVPVGALGADGVLVHPGAPNSMTYVGMARRVSATGAYVAASFYNRKPKYYQFNGTGGPLTKGTPPFRFFSSEYARFLCFSEPVHMACIGQAAQQYVPGGAGGTYGYIQMFDGTSQVGLGTYVYENPTVATPFHVGAWQPFNPGFHEVGLGGNPDADGSGGGMLTAVNTTGQVVVWA